MPYRLPGLISTAACCLGLLAGVATAQVVDPGAPPPPRVQRAGAIEYVNGGGGTEARDAITAMQPGFTLKLVFSDSTGAYLVAERVSIRNAGGELLSVADAGPWLLVKLPPGRYTVEAVYAGATQRKAVTVGAQLQTVNWRWPAAPSR